MSKKVPVPSRLLLGPDDNPTPEQQKAAISGGCKIRKNVVESKLVEEKAGYLEVIPGPIKKMTTPTESNSLAYFRRGGDYEYSGSPYGLVKTQRVPSEWRSKAKLAKKATRADETNDVSGCRLGVMISIFTVFIMGILLLLFCGTAFAVQHLTETEDRIRWTERDSTV